MDSLEKLGVQQDDSRVLERFLTRCPVRLKEIAETFGIKVKLSGLNMNISGQIKKDGDGRYLIRVNRYEGPLRQRFTVAHELAHYFLHRHFIDCSPEGIKDNVLYRSGRPYPIESQANRLAAEIIMPMALVIQKFNALGGQRTDEIIKLLAFEFQVSKRAMDIRLLSLPISIGLT